VWAGDWSREPRGCVNHNKDPAARHLHSRPRVPAQCQKALLLMPTASLRLPTPRARAGQMMRRCVTRAAAPAAATGAQPCTSAAPPIEQPMQQLQPPGRRQQGDGGHRQHLCKIRGEVAGAGLRTLQTAVHEGLQATLLASITSSCPVACSAHEGRE